MNLNKMLKSEKYYNNIFTYFNFALNSINHSFYMRYPFILLSFLAALMFSCEETPLTQAEVDVPETSALAEYHLLNVPDDSEDEFLNHAMLLSVRAIRDATVANPGAFAEAANSANVKHLNAGMKLSKFLSFSSELENSFFNSLQREVATSPKSLKRFADNDNLFQQLESALSYKGTAYDFAIHTVAEKTLESNKSTDKEIVFAVGETLTEDDRVLAYRGTSNEPIFLSEEEAKESTVYVIDFGTDFDLENAYLVPNKFDDETAKATASSENKMVGEETVLRDWRIRRRMENDKRSEYRAAATAHPNDLSNGASISGNLYEENQRRRDIGNLTPANCVLIDWDNINFGSSSGPSNRYFVFAWERDWINSSKTIFNDCSSLLSHSAASNRKHPQDVYYKECGVKITDFPSSSSETDFGTFEDEVWEISREN